MAGRTVLTVLEQTAARYGDALALHQPMGGKAGGYRTYSWNDWLRSSREIALCLRALGLQKGEIAGILSETRAEFYLVDVGIMAAGGVSAALYTAYPMHELADNIRSVGPRFLFIEDAKTLAALAKAVETAGGQMPEYLFLMTGEQAGTVSLEELQVRGRESLERNPGILARMAEELSPGDSAILYLTSGATGAPKMGLVSHPADSGQFGPRTHRAAGWTRGFNGGLPAVGAHCAANCAGVGSYADGDAGLVFGGPGAPARGTEVHPA